MAPNSRRRNVEVRELWVDHIFFRGVKKGINTSSPSPSVYLAQDKNTMRILERCLVIFSSLWIWWFKSYCWTESWNWIVIVLWKIHIPWIFIDYFQIMVIASAWINVLFPIISEKKLSMSPNMLLNFIQYRRSRKATSPNWSELEEKVRKDSVKVEVVSVHFLAAQTQWGARGHRPNRAKGQARNQGRSEGVTSQSAASQLRCAEKDKNLLLTHL